MKEIWKDIAGYEGRYMISNLGNVLSLCYGGNRKTKTAMRLKPVLHHTGYMIVGLGKKPKKICLIHILVATAFIPNTEGKPFVNHIDGDKRNNCVDNLEWVTAKENTQHAISTGLRDPRNAPKKYGSNHHSSKPVYQFDIKGNLIRKWGGQSEAARALGCKPCSIGNKIDKPGMTTLGYVWLSTPENFPLWKSKKRKYGRRINQLSVDGIIVKTWDNIDEISESTIFDRRGVLGCCQHDRKTHNGYIWRYAED